MAKTRLDVLLVERGLAQSRSLAQRLVMAGEVLVDGQVVLKPATGVEAQAALEVVAGPPFVSRGGEKLAAALLAFKVDPSGWVCADVGASTGGFTDCLLQHGARRVYAIDVGKGILAWKLRLDPRVVVMESTNARYLENLPEPVDLVTLDASFISLKNFFPVIKNWFAQESRQIIALVKPQFEAGRTQVARSKGVVRDPQVHQEVLLKVLNAAQADGYGLQGLIRSPLLGPKGNTEFLAWLIYGGKSTLNLQAAVEAVVEVGTRTQDLQSLPG
jgi:23S rRNA (cytidine1920-2'-O)/16S rRNA (cytidine1409-2'-O)-methyltransferase